MCVEAGFSQIWSHIDNLHRINFKVVVKQFATQFIIFINVAKTRPFASLNSRYSLNNSGSQQAMQSAINGITIYNGCYFCVIFQDGGCDNFTEICLLFTVS